MSAETLKKANGFFSWKVNSIIIISAGILITSIILVVGLATNWSFGFSDVVNAEENEKAKRKELARIFHTVIEKGCRIWYK